MTVASTALRYSVVTVIVVTAMIMGQILAKALMDGESFGYYLVFLGWSGLSVALFFFLCFGKDEKIVWPRVISFELVQIAIGTLLIAFV